MGLRGYYPNSMTSPEKPAHVVIDKSMTARVNVGILIAIVVVSCSGAVWCNDIANKLTNVTTTLKEVKAQLAANNGAVIQQARDIIRLQDHQAQHAKELRAHEKRLEALERGK